MNSITFPPLADPAGPGSVEQNLGAWFPRDMPANRLLGTGLWTLVAVFLTSPAPQMAQGKRDAPPSLGSFAGRWKGICADGNEFLILTLSRNGTDIGGTVSLADISGTEGQCATVVNPPSAEHSMKISEGKLQGAVLAFKGSERARFEMEIIGDGRARLKFLGTPVEDRPWELNKVN